MNCYRQPETDNITVDRRGTTYTTLLWHRLHDAPRAYWVLEETADSWIVERIGSNPDLPPKRETLPKAEWSREAVGTDPRAPARHSELSR